MTSVDFYVLSEGPENALELLACKLAEKAIRSGHRIYIQTETAEQAKQLDELLWSYKAESFLPHALSSQTEQKQHLETSNDDEALCPILIGETEAPDDCDDILINLTPNIPVTYARFQRLLELVPPQHKAREALRTNYGHYCDRGYPIKTHEISL